jgi:putative membrane protein
MKIIKNPLRIIYGFIIGSSMLLPGVSGGSMAIILGVYEELINAVSSIAKHPLRKLLLLGCYAVGGVLGVILLSGPLLALVEKQPVISSFLFMGAILACIPPLFRLCVYAVDENTEGFVLDGLPISPTIKRVKRVRLRPVPIIGAVVGVALGVGLNFIPEGLVADTEDTGIISVLVLFAAGVIIAIALVLPGISGSYVLLILGLYDEMLLAVRDMHLVHLIPFVIGVLGGIFGTTKIIDYLMKKFPQFIFLTIIGFMLGSLYEVFPGLPHGLEIPFSIAAFAVGFALIFALGMFSRPEVRYKVRATREEREGNFAKDESE